MEILVRDLQSAIENGDVVLVVAAVLMIIVFIVNSMFGDCIPKKFKPLLASLLGVVSAIAIALASGIDWYLAIATGVLLGTSAGGHFSLWGKHLFNVLCYDVDKPKSDD